MLRVGGGTRGRGSPDGRSPGEAGQGGLAGAAAVRERTEGEEGGNQARVVLREPQCPPAKAQVR